MVRLKALPETAIIMGFKGTVDFYQWKGIAVARKWPQENRANLTANTKAQWPNFALVNKSFASLSTGFKESLNSHVSGTQQRNLDAFISLSYGKQIILDPAGPS